MPTKSKMDVQRIARQQLIFRKLFFGGGLAHRAFASAADYHQPHFPSSALKSSHANQQGEPSQTKGPLWPYSFLCLTPSHARFEPCVELHAESSLNLGAGKKYSSRLWDPFTFLQMNFSISGDLYSYQIGQECHSEGKCCAEFIA